MSITLTGLPFDSKIISELEQKLIQNGFRVEDFAFEKQFRPKPYSASYALGFEHEYTVTTSGKKFSISFSDDAQFAHFFYNLCCKEDDTHLLSIKPLEMLIKKIENCVEVTKHWLVNKL